MRRQIVYSGQIPLETDLLLTNKEGMLALGYAMQAILGTTTCVDGLACTPTSPASLSVNVAPGSIYATGAVDNSDYSSVVADTTHTIVKQGLLYDSTALTFTAPGTVGYSINYLIQGAFSEVDEGSTVLPYYNSANPAVAWSGPSNSGAAQYTQRTGKLILSTKAGTAATTGTQTTPTVDSGKVPLWVVTVAYGATTITSPNIVVHPSAPFITPKLFGITAAITASLEPNLVHIGPDTGTANAMVATVTPTLSALTDGSLFLITPAATNTGATTINVNAIGVKSIVRRDGSALSAGDVVVGQKTLIVYHAATTSFQLLTPTGRRRLTTNTYFYVAPSGNDTTGDGLAWGTCWATIQAAVNKIAANYDFSGYTVTLAIGAGTYTGSIVIPVVIGGPLALLGNTTTPSSTVISTTGDCISAVGSVVSVAGLKFVSSAGSALRAYRGGQLEINGNVDFGACATAHMYASNSGSRIIISSNYNITGGAQNHMLAWLGLGEISNSAAFTATLTGTPAFSGTFAYAANVSVIKAAGMTYSGSATGSRYGVTQTAEINTGGGGANFFPGNSAGTGVAPNYI